MNFVAVEKRRELSGFVMHSSLKEGAFTAVKRNVKNYAYERAVPFFNRRYTKGTCPVKNGL